MASMYYHWLWKSITDAGSIFYTIYWQDYWPNIPSITSIAWANRWTSWETSYNLAWFQVGNQIVIYLFTFLSGTASGTASVQLYLQKYTWWRQNTGTNGSWSISMGQNSVFSWTMAIPIVRHGIWNDATDYRVLMYWSIGSESWFSQLDEFSVYNFWADTSEHNEGMLWVQWANLCYTDGYGYKHNITYDSDYATFVGSQYAGHIRIDPSVIRRIYYVDQSWYKRRTYEADNRFWSTSWQWASVGYWYRWCLWTVWDWWYAGWSRYLCFVNPNWYKMRLMNGNPNL